jgi:hypothetical protein
VAFLHQFVSAVSASVRGVSINVYEVHGGPTSGGAQHLPSAVDQLDVLFGSGQTLCGLRGILRVKQDGRWGWIISMR